MSAEDFTRCILEEDSKALTKLPGVGKKTAERLVIELKDRLQKDDSIKLPGATDAGGATIERQANPVNDAVSALISLGYKAQQASQMVRDLDVEDKSTEEIIRAALRGR
jgi:Holliday junction DNA helicase RuvA